MSSTMRSSMALAVALAAGWLGVVASQARAQHGDVWGNCGHGAYVTYGAPTSVCCTPSPRTTRAYGYSSLRTSYNCGVSACVVRDPVRYYVRSTPIRRTLSVRRVMPVYPTTRSYTCRTYSPLTYYRRYTYSRPSYGYRYYGNGHGYRSYRPYSNGRQFSLGLSFGKSNCYSGRRYGSIHVSYRR